MSIFATAMTLQRRVWELERALAEREAELAALRAPCVWKREYGGWITGGCSNRPMVYASGFAFCPYCGHPVQVAE